MIVICRGSTSVYMKSNNHGSFLCNGADLPCYVTYRYIIGFSMFNNVIVYRMLEMLHYIY